MFHSSFYINHFVLVKLKLTYKPNHNQVKNLEIFYSRKIFGAQDPNTYLRSNIQIETIPHFTSPPPIHFEQIVKLSKKKK